jgi:hypothetical protein
MIHHLITNAAVNISSDIMIMLIPLPLVFKVKIPCEKKLVLAGLLSIGMFTVRIQLPFHSFSFRPSPTHHPYLT